MDYEIHIRDRLCEQFRAMPITAFRDTVSPIGVRCK